MDKYELKVTISEIDSLISKRRFKEAAEVADLVDWRRVKNVRTLCRRTEGRSSSLSASLSSNSGIM